MNEEMEKSYKNFFPDYPDVLSIEDMSQMLRICKVKSYELVKSGQIHAVRIGHVYRIPKKSIYQYLEAVT